MKTYYYLLATLLVIAFSNLKSDAQGSYYTLDDGPSYARTELGLLTGATMYLGDLTPKRAGEIRDIMPQIGIFVRHYIASIVSVRANLYISALKGDDAQYSEPAWRKHRNFSFKSELYEASVILELDPLRSLRQRTGFPFGVYGFIGLGGCYTNPRRNFNGTDDAYFGVNDKAVSGSDLDFSSNPKHVALVAPMGLGLRYDLGMKASIFGEGGLHYGFDDEIDGFYESVSSANNDAYVLYSLGVILRF